MLYVRSSKKKYAAGEINQETGRSVYQNITQKRHSFAGEPIRT
jgi:hypothetical protein